MHKTLALPVTIFLFLLISCSHKNYDPCSGRVPCALVDPRLFYFSILDKSTGQDLFFSKSPIYPFSALKVTWTGGGDALQPQVDTLNGRHDLVMVAQGLGADTFYFKIANTKTDTLVFTAKSYRADCCTDSTVMTHITFNGQAVRESLNLLNTPASTVMPFYK